MRVRACVVLTNSANFERHSHGQLVIGIESRISSVLIREHSLPEVYMYNKNIYYAISECCVVGSNLGNRDTG